MTDDTPTTRRPWSWYVAVAGSAATIVAVAALVAAGRPFEAIYGHWILHNGPTAVIALWLGHTVLLHRQRHVGGVLLIAIGVFSAVHVATITLADFRLIAAGVAHEGTRFAPITPADLPLDASVTTWASTWLWIPIITVAFTVMMLVFPDGRLPSRRWLPVIYLAAIATATIMAAYGIEAAPRSRRTIVIGDQIDADPLARILFAVGGCLLLVAVGLSVASLAMRWRRASTSMRRQIRPVAVVWILLAVLGTTTFPWPWLWIPISLVLIWALLGTYAFAVARYRLHDIDMVVGRAVVAALVAMVVTVIYLGVVIGVGQLVGRGRDDTFVPLLAAGVVAVVFEPVRRRVRRIVDQLLYGHDLDARQVMSDLAGQLRTASSADEILDEVARLLVSGTGADRIEVTTTVMGGERAVASAGAATRDQALWAAPVSHEGSDLGHVRVFARSTGHLSPDASQLVDDVAATLGILLRNVQLTADLRAQVKALRHSRERLVHAHAEARRSLERDIHDGAQAHLITVRIRLGLAARHAEQRGDLDLADQLTQLGGKVDDAIASLRALSRGLHPPVLDGGGIAAALRSGTRDLPVSVHVRAPDLSRHDPAVETAVYFSCLEAVQNAAKHGRASEVTVEISNGDGELRFAVSDDGVGFDPVTMRRGNGLVNLEDRLSSLGGETGLDTAPGCGTIVRGRIPVGQPSSSAPRHTSAHAPPADR